MKPLALTDYTIASALGVGRDATRAALRENRSGLAPRAFETVALSTWIGEAPGVDAVCLPEALADYDCRNNRLAQLGLEADRFTDSIEAARGRYGAGRIGVFLGTSTSGILQTELAYRRRDVQSGALPRDFLYRQTHSTYSVADYVRRAFALQGPSVVVSTACSSSAKVFAAAARMIALDLIDAALVGGIDSLCLTTLYGFNSLELLASDICRPWDAARHGLSLGEAAAFALLEREGGRRAKARLLGVGESSDGHHMSSPHPQGAGAVDAMRAALAQAGLEPGAVDYLNLHGTATPNNDAAEDMAVHQVFGGRIPCSSTKGATGHTLGAAGAVEAVIAMIALEEQMIPGGLNRRAPDPALRCRYVDASEDARLCVVASNSFGFGGSNACLIFGAAA